MTFRDLIGPGRFIEPHVIRSAASTGSTRYPYAQWMPLLPESTTQPKIIPTQFIYHSMAGPELTSIEALFNYVARSGRPLACVTTGQAVPEHLETLDVPGLLRKVLQG